MRLSGLLRVVPMVAVGMCLLQAGGCTTLEFLEFAQTILLGVTAAGAIAIIKNI